MSFTTSACCAVTLNQQQEQNIYYHKKHCAEMQCPDAPANNGKSRSKNCTVVENGRVVVKPAQTQPEENS
ncbi:hypothetical protein [Mastigocladopsis repens]|uniref:hypothetical protein n=1 Tax=Mastigocladopsis repens TaxID=221287 RepID=UPI0002E3885F|nr:hypothetical protein [Mastigocladopsis repens]